MITFVSNSAEHVLVRLDVKPNGDQVWGCGECGETRLINFDPPPAHKMIVTQRGDFSARHSMGSSCAPELDAAVRLDLHAHGDSEMAPEGDRPGYTRVGGACGWRPRMPDVS